MSADTILILVVRVADAPPLPDRFWRLPCAWCGEHCWVDPESIFGTKFVTLEDVAPLRVGEPFTLPGDRKICCLRCGGVAMASLEDVDPEVVAATRRFAADFARLVDDRKKR